MDKTQVIQQAYEVFKVLEDDGIFSNNGVLPVIVYKRALLLQPQDDASAIENVFKENGWSNLWVNGIFDYHHYHSNTHEVMGVCTGTADVQLGGPNGVCVEVSRGDVLIIPAGVAHKCLKSSDDFSVVGAYPQGMDYDMKYGLDGERPDADENIKKVPLPEKDPVYGKEGPAGKNWGKLK